MSLGKINLIIFLIFSMIFLKLGAEDKIISAPIINLENLEPSFESLDNEESLNNNFIEIKVEDNKNLLKSVI